MRWTAEDSAELSRLRGVRDEAAAVVRAHPVIVRSLEERCWPQTWQALQDAVRRADRIQPLTPEGIAAAGLADGE